nr:DUF2513 domain-containing protein [Roseomonas haemaphysalidis]
MDLVRSMLLAIEASEPYADVMRMDIDGLLPEDDEQNTEYLRRYYHAELLVDAGFIKGDATVGEYLVQSITWQGYEFLDAVRDPEIWKKTKAGVKSVGTASVAIIWEIAKGYAKQAAQTKLGLPL